MPRMWVDDEHFSGRLLRTKITFIIIFGTRIHNIMCRVVLDAMFAETTIILSNSSELWNQKLCPSDNKSVALLQFHAFRSFDDRMLNFDMWINAQSAIFRMSTYFMWNYKFASSLWSLKLDIKNPKISIGQSMCSMASMVTSQPWRELWDRFIAQVDEKLEFFREARWNPSRLIPGNLLAVELVFISHFWPTTLNPHPYLRK